MNITTATATATDIPYEHAYMMMRHNECLPTFFAKTLSVTIISLLLILVPFFV